MTLPLSGPISGSQIAAELDASSTNISLRSLSSTAGFTVPDAMSEFYGYALGYDVNFWFDALDPIISSLSVEVTGTAPDNSSINNTYDLSGGEEESYTIAFKPGTTVTVTADASGTYDGETITALSGTGDGNSGNSYYYEIDGSVDGSASISGNFTIPSEDVDFYVQAYEGAS